MVASEEQLYKYNGKELDAMPGLNWYDYSARHYDPAIARFSSINPLAEKCYSISPYAYVNNNPLKYIAPTGMWYDVVIEGSNSSSLRLKTDAINLNIKSQIDFGGNRTIADLRGLAIGYEKAINLNVTPFVSGFYAKGTQQSVMFLGNSYAGIGMII